MIDVLLGLIALGTVTTAVLEVVALVSLMRIGRRTVARVERIRQQVAPLAGHVAAIRADLAKAQAHAAAQLDRVASIYAAVEGPVRQGATAIAVARSVAAILRRRPTALSLLGLLLGRR